MSPGGVVASAERTAAFRPEIEAAAVAPRGRPRHARGGDLPRERRPSRGDRRPDARVGLRAWRRSSPRPRPTCSGWRSTWRRASRSPSGSPTRDAPARDRAAARRAGRGRPALRPRAAIDGAARYLEIAGERFGADDLAVVSYHMGIGNLESVLRAYADAGERAADRRAGRRSRASPTRSVYFDSSPYAHREAYELLTGFGDESAEYLWKVRASERDPATSTATIPSGSPRPPSWRPRRRPWRRSFTPRTRPRSSTIPTRSTRRSTTASWCRCPFEPGLGWVPDKQIGELAAELDQDAGALPRAAPRGAGDAQLPGRAWSCYESNEPAPLLVTSAVRDRDYQELLVGVQPRGDQRVLAAHDRAGRSTSAATTPPGARPRPSSTCSTGSARWR